MFDSKIKRLTLITFLLIVIMWGFGYTKIQGFLSTQLLQTTTNEKPAWSPNGNSLAFASNRMGNMDIWIMNEDGTDLINLTSDSDLDDFSPVWSSDGTQIAYIRDFTIDPKKRLLSDIWIVHRDKKIDRNITGQFEELSNHFNYQHSWSPNQQYISLSSNTNEIADIWLIDLEDMSSKNLTDDLNGVYITSTWSPDSKQIAFSSVDLIESPGIWAVNVDTMEKSIIHPDVASFHVSWSPIGNRIAFIDLSNGELYLIEADGQNLTSLTPEFPDTIINFTWAPDGTSLLFEVLPNLGGDISPSSVSNSEVDIWVVDVDATGLANLTLNSNSRNTNPSWSPTRDVIAFDSNREGGTDIWTMDIDGSNLINLTRAARTR